MRKAIENSRHTVDVRVAADVRDEVYLPHFEHIVRAGVASVMSAYNSVNGEWCGQNHELLTTILKERWGFQGFVISDWLFGIRDGGRPQPIAGPILSVRSRTSGPARYAGQRAGSGRQCRRETGR
jgi:Glycosyl hydrolase family 3 N terminal domain